MYLAWRGFGSNIFMYFVAWRGIGRLISVFVRRGDVDAGLVLEELPGHLERRPPGRSLYRFMRRAPRLLALVLQSLYN